MTEPYIDVIYDVIEKLYFKQSEVTDAKYLLILELLTILKQELTNDTKSRLSNPLGTTTT